MKKLVFLLISLFTFLTVLAEEVTEEQALQKAQNFMQGKQFKQKNLRRSPSTGGDTYYVFNADDGGFVIVAGDDRMPDILGYSAHGKIDEKTASCGLKWLLGCYEQTAKNISTDKIQHEGSKKRTAKASIAPFVTTAWGQDAPYNALCPEYDGSRCPTGCVTTAMAQVINYCRWPKEQTTSVPWYTTGMGIYLEDLNPTQFDWDNMTNEDIARLMRYCGQSILTDYTPWYSSAQPTAVQDALINVFGYSQSTHYVKHSYYDEDEWEDLLYRELAEHRPILYDGYASVGHAFVLHGYDSGRFYVNWGWNGTEDGYFVLTGLTTSVGTYNTDQGATIGICPLTNNERPKVVVKSISSTNSKFTPRDDDGNINNNQVSCILASDLSEQKTMQIGLALYSDDSFQKILNWESHEFSIGEIYNYNTTFDLENIANGTYRIVAVWRNSESDSWLADANSSENYLEITLDDERMRIRTFPMSMDERQTEEVVATINGLTYCLKTDNSLRLATVMNEKKHKPSGDVNIPDDVEYNGIKYHVYDAEEGAFDNCPDLTSLSTAMTKFPYISNCENLINLELREGVSFMNGFGNCFQLESLELPKSVIFVSQVSADYTLKTIRFKNPNSFEYQMSFGYPEEWVTALTDIYFASPFAPKLNLSAIEEFPVNSHVTLHVPEGSKANYEVGGWQGWNIVEDQQLPTEQAVECGYCTGSEFSPFSWIYDSGNNDNEFAIRVLPEMLAPFVGKTINHIRINPGFTADYVFISSPETDYIVKQPVSGIESGRSWTWYDVFLSEPYTITGETLYIGWGAYAQHMTSATPAINEDPTNEGYWHRVMGTDTSNKMNPGVWENLSEEAFYRPIPLKFYISFSGDDLLNDLTVNEVSVVSKGGDNYTFKAKVTNHSPKTIQNYKLDWGIDGEVKGEKSFQTSLVNNQSETIEFDISAKLDGKNHSFNYVITSVNGQPDDFVANSSGTVSFIAAKTVFPRKIVMEEATATECGSCVRGIEITDRLSKKYPDNFLPIFIHNYGEMNTKDYEPVIEKFPMMPNSLVNRINITDGMLYDQVMETFKRQNLYAEAMIKPTAFFTDEDRSSVTVTTETVFGFSDTDGSAYRIAYVVMEDNVGPYMQSNDYSDPSAVPDESDFMDVWVHKGPQVEMMYDNVARDIIGGINGVEGSVPDIIKEGEIYKYSYSFKLPDNIQSKNNIRIVTLLIDEKTGEIINAAKVPMELEIVPIIEEEVTFSENIDKDTDLSNTVIENTYYNMDAENGDGYDAEEQALVLNSTTTEEQMTAIQDAEVGDEEIQEKYKGLIFELAIGKGTVTVDAMTIGTHVLNVQIGKSEPTKITKSERGTVDVTFNITEPTYVYLYATTADGSAARLNRAPSAAANSVLLYGYKVTMDDFEPVTIMAKSFKITYGDDLPTFEFTSEGAEVEGYPSITCEATKTSPVGTYPIVISKGSVTNYKVTYVNGTLTIEKAPLKITAKDYTIKQSEALPTFEAMFDGFKNNEMKDVLTKQPTITTTATSASEPGVYDIIVSGAEAQNYEISYVNGKLTIEDIDGIIGISVDHPADVYDLQGNKIRSKITSLSGLSKGVYIIKNKKVVIK